MNRLLHYILTTVMVLHFIFAGMGLNVVHYCCDECREAGIIHVTEESCDAIHLHESHHHDSSCEHHNDCWFKHLSTSTTIISKMAQLPISQTVELFLTDIFSYFSPIIAPIHLNGSEYYLPLHTGRLVTQLVCSWLI